MVQAQHFRGKSMLKLFGKILGRGPKTLDVTSRFDTNKVPMRTATSMIYRAVDKESGTKYGLKIVSTKRMEAFRERFATSFETEGEIMLKCAHGNVLPVHETGTTTDGQHYILTDPVQDPTLDRFISGEIGSTIPDRVSLIHQLANALFHIHQQGFIHRDICPKNLLVTDLLQKVKIFDFALTIPTQKEFNVRGNRTGTPEYMAPEIVRRRPTDHRVDLFAFGVTAYQLLTFKHPWGTNESDSKAALRHDSFEVTPILKHRPDLNRRLAKAIHQCLEVDPDQRMPNMKVFIARTADIKREVA